MHISTKYNLGDRVIRIDHTKKPTFIECEACDGEGIVILKNKIKSNCPVCFGRCGSTKYEDEKWNTVQELTIGMIKVELEKNKETTKYMCVETGIGSGSVWNEKDLFPTKEAAEKECKKLNKKKRKICLQKDFVLNVMKK
jgi:hypothetical protein